MLVGASSAQLRKVRQVGASNATDERGEGRRQNRQADTAWVEVPALRSGIDCLSFVDLSVELRVQVLPPGSSPETQRARLHGQDVAGDAQHARGRHRSQGVRRKASESFPSQCFPPSGCSGEPGLGGNKPAAASLTRPRCYASPLACPAAPELLPGVVEDRPAGAPYFLLTHR